MASGTVQTHGDIVRAAFSGEVDLHGNTNINWYFTSASYTPNPDDVFQSSLTAAQVTGTNLPSGGVDATGATVTYDSATNTTTFTVADLSVANATASGIKNAHLVDQTSGAAATNRIIASVTFDTALSPENGTLSIDVPANGIFAIAV
jgi:hypothetical protein